MVYFLVLMKICETWWWPQDLGRVMIIFPSQKIVKKKKDLAAMSKNNHSKKLNTLAAFKMVKIMFEKMLMLPQHMLWYSLQ